MFDGREALGQNLAVAAVGTEDEVVGRQVVGLPHGRCLLADGEMRGAAMVILDPLIRTFLLDAVQHVLELADHDHVPVHAHQVGRAVGRALGHRVGHIGVQGNLRPGQHRLLAGFDRIDGDEFGHGLVPLSTEYV